MWPSVKLVFVKSKDHWKATGSEKDLERMAGAVDQSKHLKRTSGRDEEGNLIKASVHESFKMPKPPKKDWYIEGIDIKFKAPKVRDALVAGDKVTIKYSNINLNEIIQDVVSEGIDNKTGATYMNPADVQEKLQEISGEILVLTAMLKGRVIN